MPVYNTKTEYLSYAVDSVLRQTYQNFELILVDDGSAPECAQLCDEIRCKDERIRVAHQKNAGASTARNHGADLATGDYLMYMDSDDCLAPVMLQEMVEVLEATQAQFVFGGIQQIHAFEEFRGADGSEQVQYHLFDKEEMDFVVRSFFTQRNPEFSRIKGVGAVNRGPCARALRMDLAKTIRFEGHLVIGEDVEWNMRVLRACDKVCFVNSVWYGYLCYEESTIHKYYGNRAKLMEAYHDLMYQRNREFCDRDPVPYGINMAVSFYSMVDSEYLSDQCPLTRGQKRREIRQILNRAPWTFMLKRDVFPKLPARYRLFLLACQIGLGVEMLQIWGNVKNAK